MWKDIWSLVNFLNWFHDGISALTRESLDPDIHRITYLSACSTSSESARSRLPMRFSPRKGPDQLTSEILEAGRARGPSS